MLVFTNPLAGQDDAFNEWYDSHHVADVLKVPGVLGARRYDLAAVEFPEGDDAPWHLPSPAHRYLAIYELDRDPDEVMKEFLNRADDGRMPLSETLDMTTIALTAWTPRSKQPTTE